MAERDTVEMLSSVPLFQGLSKKELAAIATSGKQVEHPAGREVVKEGSTGGAGFHLILEGTATVLAGDRTLNQLGPGDYFGEMSLIDEGPRSATVRADTDLRAFALTSWAFLPLLDRHPSIARKMLVELSRRLRQADRSATM